MRPWDRTAGRPPLRYGDALGLTRAGGLIPRSRGCESCAIGYEKTQPLRLPVGSDASRKAGVSTYPDRPLWFAAKTTSTSPEA